MNLFPCAAHLLLFNEQSSNGVCWIVVAWSQPVFALLEARWRRACLPSSVLISPGVTFLIKFPTVQSCYIGMRKKCLMLKSSAITKTAKHEDSLCCQKASPVVNCDLRGDSSVHWAPNVGLLLAELFYLKELTSYTVSCSELWFGHADQPGIRTTHPWVLYHCLTN